MNLTWPNPVSDNPVFKELVNQPGVYQVTSDEEEWAGQPFRHMIVTNVSWLWQLTKDSKIAHKYPTFSWDWRKHAAESQPTGTRTESGF